jgi:hypothetical protein
LEKLEKKNKRKLVDLNEWLSARWLMNDSRWAPRFYSWLYVEVNESDSWKKNKKQKQKNLVATQLLQLVDLFFSFLFFISLFFSLSLRLKCRFANDDDDATQEAREPSRIRIQEPYTNYKDIYI